MLHKSIQIRKSSIEGTGLIATEFIPKGTIIWYLDSDEEKLTLDQLKKLPQKIQKLAYQYKDDYIIVRDGSQYMNHSCDPNTWWRDDETLEALRDIHPGDEVTYDYATAEIDEHFRSDWHCNCGAKNCRKIITSKDCLTAEFRKKYQKHLPSWTLKFIKDNA